MNESDRRVANEALSAFMRSIESESIVRVASDGSIWVAVSKNGTTSSAVDIQEAINGLTGENEIGDIILRHIEFGVWQ